jgi:hypothetical protein
VTISGANLSGATAVHFGDAAAPGFTVSSPTLLTATAPAGSGKVPVTVTGPGGTSQSAQFTYVGPSITALTPAYGSPRGGTPVNVTGNNLNGATAVTFGGTPAQSFTVNSNSSVTAVSPAFSGTEKVSVVVTTPAGKSGGQQFNWGPTITNVSGSRGAGAGAQVMISGTNLGEASAVSFGGTAATFHVDSDTSITAVAPSPTGKTVDLVVANPAGASNTARFSYPAPSITGLNPSSGGAGTTVVISGRNLTGATSVKFGSANASFTFQSDSSITAVAPSGSGAVQVTVTSPAGTSRGQRFTYPAAPPPAAAPTISSISPSSGPHTAATVVTITGTNFGGATCSVVGTTSTPIPCTVGPGNTMITLTMPYATGTGTATVVVTTPGGSARVNFTYT